MISRKYGSYSEFKDSGSGWLGKIPTHWSANKLKFVANAFASNVDKKTKDGEIPVRLCNYTDVYYNDVIRPGMPFMVATATQEQITKFTLRAGDTIITKDSEDPNDIAIPTFVAQDMPGVICGYHLSVIRPAPTMFPEFLNKTFQCAFARAYFATRSNGLTRYGLGGQALGSIVIPVPPLDEQTQIAKFLDYETANIDALIAKQQQLIALLQEKRQAVISHAVTKGLNPAAPLRDSGVAWLGQVPAHWEVGRLKHITDFITSGPRGWSDLISDEGTAVFLQSGDLNDKLGLRVDTAKRITPPLNAESARTKMHNGDVVVCITGANTGRVAVAIQLREKVYVNQHLSLVRPQKDQIIPEYLATILASSAVKAYFAVKQYGLKEGLSLTNIAETPLCLPPIEEQVAIVSHLNKLGSKLDKLEDAAESQVELLQERRTALISAAVTGKIDVRGWQPPPAAADGAHGRVNGSG